MKNLEQIRAYNAITARGKWAGVNDGEVVKKVPTLIRENGLLAAAAFAVDKKGGYQAVFDAIIAHLADKKIAKLANKMSLEEFIQSVSNSDSSVLWAITSESLAYLNYLRRFAKKPAKGEGGE